MRYTLPKSNTLRGYQSFSKVISNGSGIQNTLLAGYFTVQPSQKPTVRIGFTVSKKRNPLAVHRNKIKRLMREAARKHFFEVRHAAAEKKLTIEIVVSYRGTKDRDVMQIKLNDIEPEWMQLQQRILDTL